MFKIFSFGFGKDSKGFYFNDMGKINRIIQSFLDNIDIDEIRNNYEEAIGKNEVKEIEDKSNEFIKFKQYEDMYILSIDLRGVDIRELSIQYDIGVIEINLNRAEMQKSGFGALSNNMIVKRTYNKRFENIEQINTDQIFKSIDNGIFSMRMPKKYVLENEKRIIEVDSYEDDVDK